MHYRERDGINRFNTATTYMI